MRAGTRMMMIASLGEGERRIGFRSESEEMRGEGNRNYSPQNRYEERMPSDNYGPQSRDDYEERYPPRNYRPQNSGPWGGAEGYRSEGGGNREMNDGRWRGEEMRSRRYREESRGEGGRYESEQRPQSHYGGEEGGEDVSGTFRHRKAQGHVPEEEEKLTEERVKKWVESMKDDSGRTGPRFTMEQAELQRSNHCMQCDKLEFYAAINMMYSDYCEVARRLNVDKTEFYALMAKAFLLDKDAGKDKLKKYMVYVAEK